AVARAARAQPGPTSKKALSQKANVRHARRLPSFPGPDDGRLLAVDSERPAQAAEMTKATAGLIVADASMRDQAQAPPRPGGALRVLAHARRNQLTPGPGCRAAQRQSSTWQLRGRESRSR